MPLQEQTATFKFAGGVETKMDSKAVPTTRLLALENGVFTKAISISKRNGYEAYATAIDGSSELIDTGKRLARRENDLLQFTSKRCYSKHTGSNQWSDTGAVLCPTATDRAVVQTSSQQTMPDHAIKDNVEVVAWEDSRGGVYWTVRDTRSGRVYRAATQADANGQRPRCVPCGDVLHVYYAVPTQRAIMVLVINPSSPSAAVTPAILVDDLDTTDPVYDAVPTTREGSPALVAWREYATLHVRVGYVTAGGVLGSPASGHPSVGRVADATNHLSGITTPLAVSFLYVDGADADRVFFSCLNGANAALFTLSGGTSTVAVGASVSTSTAVFTDPGSVARIALVCVAGSNWVAVESSPGAASNRFTRVNSVVVGGAAGTARTLRSVGLASRAFEANDDAFAVFVHDTTYFNVYLAYRLSDFTIAGRHLSGSASGAPTRSHLSSVHVDENEVATVVLPYKVRVASVNSDKFTEEALRQIRLDFDDDNSHQYAQLGNGLYLAGACPLHYDGRVWTEQGFHVGPELIIAVTAAGGFMTSTGVYLYKAWYEWTDALGEIHRGPESIGTEVTLGGSDTQVTLTLPTLRVTAKENVRICVARSKNGDTSKLFRVTSLDPTTSGAAANGYIANDTTIDSVTLVDRMSDDDLAEEEAIYTTGGILSNDPVALGSVVAASKTRLFFTDASNGSVVRYSQRIAAGYGLEVAPELAHDVKPEGGDITALAVMDDIVYAFKRDAIFAFNGPGPLENGSTALGGFSESVKIPGDVGCVNPSSIIETPDGLMFKSQKGIWLLARDRTVSYVGSPMEAYNAQTVRRASAFPDRSGVVFLTDDGMTLHYDYLFRQWSTFTNHQGYDSVVVDNTYHYLRTDGRVFRETIGEYSDAGSRITLRIETAWIHLVDHLQGFQRFWIALLLGTWQSPHQLGVQTRTNYNENWSDPWWVDATGETDNTGWLTGDNCAPIGDDPIDGSTYGEGAFGDGPYGGTVPDIYQWEIGLFDEGQSIQLRFEDFEKNGLAGASFELTEITITGGVMAPTVRPFGKARSA